MVAPITLFPPYQENSTYIKIIEDSAIVFGSAGTIFNALLFWVISKNTGVDKKCRVIYKNLAAIDCFNCLVIPLCYFSIDAEAYSLNEYNVKNGILYLLFGATVNIPYILLIVLGVARIMIFQHRLFYSNRLQVKFVSIVCTLIWVIGIGAPVGFWLLYLAVTHNTDVVHHASILRELVKCESVLLAMLIIVTSLIMLCTIVKMKRFRVATVITSTQLRSLASELKSAIRTFTLFFISVFVWSLFPFVFAVMFVICGPAYTRLPRICQTYHYEIFIDPKSSYALTSLSLCCMSITNCGILLSQRSFIITMKFMWRMLSSNKLFDSCRRRRPEEGETEMLLSKNGNQSVKKYSGKVGTFGTGLEDSSVLSMASS